MSLSTSPPRPRSRSEPVVNTHERDGAQGVRENRRVHQAHPAQSSAAASHPIDAIDVALEVLPVLRPYLVVPLEVQQHPASIYRLTSVAQHHTAEVAAAQLQRRSSEHNHHHQQPHPRNEKGEAAAAEGDNVAIVGTPGGDQRSRSGAPTSPVAGGVASSPTASLYHHLVASPVVTASTRIQSGRLPLSPLHPTTTTSPPSPRQYTVVTHMTDSPPHHPNRDRMLSKNEAKKTVCLVDPTKCIFEHKQWRCPSVVAVTATTAAQRDAVAVRSTAAPLYVSTRLAPATLSSPTQPVELSSSTSSPNKKPSNSIFARLSFFKTAIFSDKHNVQLGHRRNGPPTGDTYDDRFGGRTSTASIPLISSSTNNSHNQQHRQSAVSLSSSATAATTSTTNSASLRLRSRPVLTTTPLTAADFSLAALLPASALSPAITSVQLLQLHWMLRHPREIPLRFLKQHANSSLNWSRARKCLSAPMSDSVGLSEATVYRCIVEIQEPTPTTTLSHFLSLSTSRRGQNARPTQRQQQPLKMTPTKTNNTHNLSTSRRREQRETSTASTSRGVNLDEISTPNGSSSAALNPQASSSTIRRRRLQKEIINNNNINKPFSTTATNDIQTHKRLPQVSTDSIDAVGSDFMLAHRVMPRGGIQSGPVSYSLTTPPIGSTPTSDSLFPPLATPPSAAAAAVTDNTALSSSIPRSPSSLVSCHLGGGILGEGMPTDAQRDPAVTITNTDASTSTAQRHPPSPLGHSMSLDDHNHHDHNGLNGNDNDGYGNVAETSDDTMLFSSGDDRGDDGQGYFDDDDAEDEGTSIDTDDVTPVSDSDLETHAEEYIGHASIYYVKVKRTRTNNSKKTQHRDGGGVVGEGGCASKSNDGDALVSSHTDTTPLVLMSTQYTGGGTDTPPLSPPPPVSASHHHRTLYAKGNNSTVNKTGSKNSSSNQLNVSTTDVRGSTSQHRQDNINNNGINRRRGRARPLPLVKHALKQFAPPPPRAFVMKHYNTEDVRAPSMVLRIARHLTSTTAEKMASHEARFYELIAPLFTHNSMTRFHVLNSLVESEYLQNEFSERMLRKYPQMACVSSATAGLSLIPPPMIMTFSSQHDDRSGGSLSPSSSAGPSSQSLRNVSTATATSPLPASSPPTCSSQHHQHQSTTTATSTTTNTKRMPSSPSITTTASNRTSIVGSGGGGRSNSLGLNNNNTNTMVNPISRPVYHPLASKYLSELWGGRSGVPEHVLNTVLRPGGKGLPPALESAMIEARLQQQESLQHQSGYPPHSQAPTVASSTPSQQAARFLSRMGPLRVYDHFYYRLWNEQCPFRVPEVLFIAEDDKGNPGFLRYVCCGSGSGTMSAIALEDMEVAGFSFDHAKDHHHPRGQNIKGKSDGTANSQPQTSWSKPVYAIGRSNTKSNSSDAKQKLLSSSDTPESGGFNNNVSFGEGGGGGWDSPHDDTYLHHRRHNYGGTNDTNTTAAVNPPYVGRPRGLDKKHVADGVMYLMTWSTVPEDFLSPTPSNSSIEKNKSSTFGWLSRRRPGLHDIRHVRAVIRGIAFFHGTMYGRGHEPVLRSALEPSTILMFIHRCSDVILARKNLINSDGGDVVTDGRHPIKLKSQLRDKNDHQHHNSTTDAASQHQPLPKGFGKDLIRLGPIDRICEKWSRYPTTTCLRMPAVRDTLHFIQKNWVPIRTASLEILMRDECVLHGDVHYKNVGFRRIATPKAARGGDGVPPHAKKQSSSMSSFSSSNIFGENNNSDPEVSENIAALAADGNTEQSSGKGEGGGGGGGGGREEGFQACFVDFQSAGPGSIAAELLYFLCTSCPVDVAEEEYWSGNGVGMNSATATTATTSPHPTYPSTDDQRDYTCTTSANPSTAPGHERLPALHVSLAGLSIVVPQQSDTKDTKNTIQTPPPSPNKTVSTNKNIATSPRRNSSEECEHEPTPKPELDEAAFYGAAEGSTTTCIEGALMKTSTPSEHADATRNEGVDHADATATNMDRSKMAGGCLGDSFTPSRKLLLLEPPHVAGSPTPSPRPHHNKNNNNHNNSSITASPLATTTGGASVIRVPSNTNKSFPASLRDSFAGLAATISGSGGGGGGNGGAWRTKSNASPHQQHQTFGGVSRLESYKDSNAVNLRTSLLDDGPSSTMNSMTVDAFVVRHLVTRKQHHHYHHASGSGHGSSSNPPHHSKSQAAASALDHPPWFRSASVASSTSHGVQNTSSSPAISGGDGATSVPHSAPTKKSISPLYTTDSIGHNEQLLTSSGVYQGDRVGSGSRGSSSTLLSPLAAGGLQEYHVLPADLLPTVFQNMKTSENTDPSNQKKNENMLIVNATPLHDSAKEYKLQRSRLKKIALNATLLPPAFDYMANTYFHYLRVEGDAVAEKPSVWTHSGHESTRKTHSEEDRNHGSDSSAPHQHTQKMAALLPPVMTSQISCATRAASEERTTLEAAINRYEGLERLERRRLRKTAKMMSERKGSKGQMMGRQASVAAAAAAAAAGGGGGLLGSFGTSVPWGQARSVTSSPALSFAQPTTADAAGPTSASVATGRGGGSMAVEPFTLGDHPITIAKPPAVKPTSQNGHHNGHHHPHHHHHHRHRRRQDGINGDFGASHSTTQDRTPRSSSTSSPDTSDGDSGNPIRTEEAGATRPRPIPSSTGGDGGGGHVGSLSLLSDIMRVGGGAGNGGADDVKRVGADPRPSLHQPPANTTSITASSLHHSSMNTAINPPSQHQHRVEQGDEATKTFPVALHSVLSLAALQHHNRVSPNDSSTLTAAAATASSTTLQQQPPYTPTPLTPPVPMVRQDTLQGDGFDAPINQLSSSPSSSHIDPTLTAPPVLGGGTSSPPLSSPPRRFMNLQELFHFDSCIIDEYYNALPDHVKVMGGGGGAAAVVRDAGLFGPTPPEPAQSTTTHSQDPSLLPSTSTATCRPITKERLLYEVYLLARHWAGCLLFDLRGGSPQERDRFRAMQQFTELISWGERTARRVLLTAASVYCVLDSHFEIMDRNAIAVAEIGDAINALRDRV